jgi:BirA family biotin operon repressor/biotin-[acetyl-CoA-carboxylase] ligase
MKNAFSMRQSILGLLRHGVEGATVISGERISARVGVSRVAVWKHIKKLQALGYDIDVTPNGYRMVTDSDTPFAWELPERMDKIHHYMEVESTMDVALALARKQAPDFSVVVAERQTMGRGRLQRIWHSDRGGLYFTIILRPELQPEEIARANLGACLVLSQVINELFGIDARVKWPNDILVDGRKIVGMLSQMEAEADRVSFFNIGIGVNVNNDPTSVEPKATSIANILGRQVSRKKLLADFLDAFEQRIQDEGFQGVVGEWKRNTITLGKKVSIVMTGATLTGLAKDIDDTGALVLELADGSLRTVHYGDCFHQQ